jgi:uncharacterized membrane protein YsdA (DUF1294 family)
VATPRKAGGARVRGAPALAPQGPASCLAIGAFALLYLVAVLRWGLPAWPLGIYGTASVASLVVYAVDKSAARLGRWRIPESTLLMLGLCCGWPGAIVAQLWLRHKSSKTSFRLMFWATVLLNMAAFTWLAQLAAP